MIIFCKLNTSHNENHGNQFYQMIYETKFQEQKLGVQLLQPYYFNFKGLLVGNNNSWKRITNLLLCVKILEST